MVGSTEHRTGFGLSVTPAHRWTYTSCSTRPGSVRADSNEAINDFIYFRVPFSQLMNGHPYIEAVRDSVPVSNYAINRCPPFFIQKRSEICLPTFVKATHEFDYVLRGTALEELKLGGSVVEDLSRAPFFCVGF